MKISRRKFYFIYYSHILRNCVITGCSGSPRLQRRRRARERRKVRSSSEKDDAGDELAYIDSLPEVSGNLKNFF